jgi:hypothetical protein
MFLAIKHKKRGKSKKALALYLVVHIANPRVKQM